MKFKKWLTGTLSAVLLSAGTVNAADYVIDTDKVIEIDFLTGNEGYKQDWMTVQKQRLGLHFVKQAVKKNIFHRMIQALKKKF